MNEKIDIVEKIENFVKEYKDKNLAPPCFLILSPPLYEELKQDIFGDVEKAIENTLDNYAGMEVCISMSSYNDSIYVL